MCAALGFIIVSDPTTLTQAITSSVVFSNEQNKTPTPTVAKQGDEQVEISISATEESNPTPNPTPTQEVVRTELNPISTTTIPTHFLVSNQSLGTGISAVKMTVSLDSEVILDQQMAVEDQHNFAAIDQNTSPGSHAVSVIVGDPYFLSTRKVVDIIDERRIVIEFWFNPLSIYIDERSPAIIINVLDENPGIK
jgi:hypothetical protein